MYHPIEPSAEEEAAGFTDDDDFEFIELQNQGERTLALSGIHFTRGIQFDFAGSEVTSLAPDEFVVLVSNLAAFEARYGPGINVAGEYTGRLNNGGERVTVSGGIWRVDYGSGLLRRLATDRWWWVFVGVGQKGQYR